MTDEIKDGFDRAKELTQSITECLNDNNAHLAKMKLRSLQNYLEVLEAQIEIECGF